MRRFDIDAEDAAKNYCENGDYVLFDDAQTEFVALREGSKDWVQLTEIAEARVKELEAALVESLGVNARLEQRVRELEEENEQNISMANFNKAQMDVRGLDIIKLQAKLTSYESALTITEYVSNSELLADAVRDADCGVLVNLPESWFGENVKVIVMREDV